MPLVRGETIEWPQEALVQTSESQAGRPEYRRIASELAATLARGMEAVGENPPRILPAPQAEA